MHPALSSQLLAAYGPDAQQVSVHLNGPAHPRAPYLITLRVLNAAGTTLTPSLGFLSAVAMRLHLQPLSVTDRQVMLQIHASQPYAPALANTPDLHGALLALMFQLPAPLTTLAARTDGWLTLQLAPTLGGDQRPARPPHVRRAAPIHPPGTTAPH